MSTALGSLFSALGEELFPDKIYLYIWIYIDIYINNNWSKKIIEIPAFFKFFFSLNMDVLIC